MFYLFLFKIKVSKHLSICYSYCYIIFFNHKFLHTFEILTEAYFCASYNILLDRQSVSPWIISEVCQWCNFRGKVWTVECYVVGLVFLKCTKIWLSLKVGRGLGDVGREHARGLEDVGCRDWRT